MSVYQTTNEFPYWLSSQEAIVLKQVLTVAVAHQVQIQENTNLQPLQPNFQETTEYETYFIK